MKDIIYLGWLGWLVFDKVVDFFLFNFILVLMYYLNECFFSKDWVIYDGDVKEF